MSKDFLTNAGKVKHMIKLNHIGPGWKEGQRAIKSRPVTIL
jgi:hypothetical protein